MSVVPFFLIQNPERNIGEENIRHLKYILLFQISLDICISFDSRANIWYCYSDLKVLV